MWEERGGRPPEAADSLTPLSEWARPIDPDAADRRWYATADAGESPRLRSVGGRAWLTTPRYGPVRPDGSELDGSSGRRRLRGILGHSVGCSADRQPASGGLHALPLEPPGEPGDGDAVSTGPRAAPPGQPGVPDGGSRAARASATSPDRRTRRAPSRRPGPSGSTFPARRASGDTRSTTAPVDADGGERIESAFSVPVLRPARGSAPGRAGLFVKLVHAAARGGLRHV